MLLFILHSSCLDAFGALGRFLLLDETLPNDNSIHVLFLPVRSRLETPGLGDKSDPLKTEAVPDRERRVVICGKALVLDFAVCGGEHTLEHEVEYRSSVTCRIQSARGTRDKKREKKDEK